MTTLKTTFSDGDVFYAGVTSDTDKLNGITTQINSNTQLAGSAEKINNERAINRVSATNTEIITYSSQKLIDKFLDSTGQNNTVDTGNTTGLYNIANKYYGCSTSATGASLDQTTNATQAGTSSGTTQWGMQGTTNLDCFCISITKHANCTATKGKIYDTSGNLLATATFSGNVATFSSPYYLVAGVVYRFICDKDGASYTFTYKDPAANPYVNDYITYTASCHADSIQGDFIYNIVSVQVRDAVYADALVQSAVATVPTGMTKVFVTPLMYEAPAGSDNITFDVSIDNGAHYTTAVPINTWTTITSANGTQLIIKMNLDTNTGTTTPKVLGWNVLLE